MDSLSLPIHALCCGRDVSAPKLPTNWLKKANCDYILKPFFSLIYACTTSCNINNKFNRMHQRVPIHTFHLIKLSYKELLHKTFIDSRKVYAKLVFGLKIDQYNKFET